MSTQTFDEPRKLTEATEASDNWLPVEVYGPDFVRSVQDDIESLCRSPRIGMVTVRP